MKINVQTLHEGQLGRYKDSNYEYRITTDMSAERTEQFCTNFLYPCKKERKDSLDNYYYLTIKDKNESGLNVFEYLVVSPYTG